MVVPILSVYADTLGASSFWIGVVFAAFAFSRTICMPVFGRMADRYEKKYMMAAGLFFYAIISLGYLIAPTVFLLTIVRFVHGISSAMIAPVAMAYLGGIAGKGEEARVMSRFQASMLFGFGAGPLMGGVIYDLFGFSAGVIFQCHGGSFLFPCGECHHGGSRTGVWHGDNDGHL